MTIDIQELRDALEVIKAEDKEIERLNEIKLQQESDVRRVTAIAYIKTLNLNVNPALSLAEQKIKYYENISLLKIEMITGNYVELRQEAKVEITNQLKLVNIVKDKQRLAKIV